MDSFIAAYLTKHDFHSFVPMDVLRICMSYCGLIPQLLPSFADWKKMYDDVKYVGVDYNEFTRFSHSEVSLYGKHVDRFRYRHSINNTYSKDILGLDLSERKSVTICALVGDDARKGIDENELVRFDHIIPMFSVRIGITRSCRTSKVVWVGMSNRYQRTNAMYV